MKYDDVIVKEIETEEEYTNASTLLQEEFPDHKDTMLTFYEFILIAKFGEEIVGMITANRYLPNRALLCDIVVHPDYRSKAIGIKLLKGMGRKVKSQGYDYLMGFTPKKNRQALNTYKRVYTRQEEQIVTVSDVAISIPIIEQIEHTIRAREARRSKGK
jgi:ribosomal protein S18 acetylase RimI-like enzyme